LLQHESGERGYRFIDEKFDTPQGHGPTCARSALYQEPACSKPGCDNSPLGGFWLAWDFRNLALNIGVVVSETTSDTMIEAEQRDYEPGGDRQRDQREVVKRVIPVQYAKANGHRCHRSSARCSGPAAFNIEKIKA
jgi:hypothetical protein